MENALMIGTLIIGLLMISACMMYDSKGNASVDNEVRETGKNAVISKAIKVLAFLFFSITIAQVILA